MERKNGPYRAELVEKLPDGTLRYRVVRTRPADEVDKEVTNVPVLPLKIDLSKEGLDMLFKEYELIMLLYVWEISEPAGSRILDRVVSERLPEGKTISRASVIFAANRFVDNGIWDYITRTGKGGHHKRYFAVLTEEQLWEHLRVTVIKKMVEASGDNTLFDGKWKVDDESRTDQ